MNWGGIIVVSASALITISALAFGVWLLVELVIP